LLPIVVVVIGDVGIIAFLGIGIEHKPISGSNERPDSAPPHHSSIRVVGFVHAFRESHGATRRSRRRSRHA
jgi:hypothetical protein